MEQPARILVVDDEIGIRYFLNEILTDVGYHVVTVDNGEAAMESIAAQEFDLALLDLKLTGGIGGLDILVELRQRSPDTAVIVLTAHASLDTAVEALRQGAHDYLFKPCEPEKLRESVRQGLIKRQRQTRQREVLNQLEHHLSTNLSEILSTAIERAITPDAEHVVEDDSRFIQQGDLMVDIARHIITLNGKLVEFSTTEFDLVAYLLEHAPRVISPQELAKEVLAYEGEIWEIGDIIRTHIYRVRQKMKAVDSKTDLIHTVRGVGYTIHT
ncbi:MAG: response regulator transcription factor [Anaerolineae bacterium]|nr:response regulator transcription factor [Anaerolineae bacterium]